MKDAFWISPGAARGANLRYGLGRLASQHLSASVPYDTLIVNISGSSVGLPPSEGDE